ncbi:hypothetical protein L226DRAFT_531717 [Lentinus tigrinus ALCF2SS1-7]|uniref:uncharacterized protein n=1 Tax=Lentinus tigrinus ALCF2SS1-7 TaxID=1328758 RepID=UPI0011661C28|nr:hypothetical protein L226DRAFT_531717 [Lentinus tigrinus ALCF2SS1-7]
MDVMKTMMPATAPSPQLPDMVVFFARNQLYAKQVWWFLASFIGLVAVCQSLSWVISKAFATSSMPREADPEGRQAIRRRERDWSRLPLTVVNYYRVLAFRHTVGVGQLLDLNITIAEALITVGYIVALFTWEFINTTTLAGQRLSWMYWSGRAGTLAIAQFPLITALGTKNNILSYITGVSYDKLNYLHRMAARVTFVLLWIHAGTKMYFLPPIVYESWFIRVGITAIVAVSILLVISVRPIRARFYETFFYTHVSMVLIILVGGFFHADEAARLGEYVWPCFLIWGADRLLRLFRVAYFNSNVYGGNSALEATVELVSPQFVKLGLTRPSHFKWTPGQAAFLIVPEVSGFPLEAHPFTIASVDSRYRLRNDSAGKRYHESGKCYQVEAGESSAMALNEEKSRTDIVSDHERVEFFINVREGFTKRLAAAASRGEMVKVFVDGPYGFSPNLKGDDTVVVVAGGSGVSLAISTFLGVVSDVQNARSKTRKIVFLWSIRDAKQIEWISKALTNALELAPPSLEISVRIFVTGRQNPLPITQTLTMNSSYSMTTLGSPTPTNDAFPKTITDSPSVQITQGRPDIRKVLRDEVDATVGRLSVTVCGSAAIAKSCRDALRLPFSTALHGGPDVVLHVESFGYA